MDYWGKIEDIWIHVLTGIPSTALVSVGVAIFTGTIDLFQGLLIFSFVLNITLLIVFIAERKKSAKLEKTYPEQLTKITLLEKRNEELSKYVEIRKRLEAEILNYKDDRIDKFIRSDIDPHFEIVENITKELYLKNKKIPSFWKYTLSDMNVGDEIKVVIAGDGEFDVIIAKYTKHDNGSFTFDKMGKESGTTPEWNSTYHVDEKGHYSILVSCKSERVKFRVNVKVSKAVNWGDPNDNYVPHIPTLSGKLI